MKQSVWVAGFAAALALFAVSNSFAQDVKLDARFKTTGADTANYFNWSLGKDSVKDKFDAASGASVSGTTGAFNKVRYDSETTKKAAIPVGLRNLLLFPVSSFEVPTADAFTVVSDKNGIVVRFVHYGTAYQLTTDAKGNFDLTTGAKVAKQICENVGGAFVLKPEFVKAGGDVKKMADLDWSKLTLVADARDPAATRWYEGKLAFGYKDGVLTVKGNLVEKK